MINILSNWNIEFDNITDVQKDVWCIDSSYYLKAIDNNEIRTLQLYRQLGQMGIPAPEIICTKEGKDYFIYKEKYYFLTRKLEGIHLTKEDIIYNPEVAQSVGQVIAKLHKAFFVLTDEYLFEDKNLVDELNGWIKSNLEENASNSYTYSIFNECLRELKLVYGSLERHLIHRDVHLGNLLFANYKISGYIDFDLTQVNARIFDIAYFIVFWIIDELHNEKILNNWKESIQYFLKGYQQEQNQKLSVTEINAIVIMMCCIEILFVAYFFSISDSNNALKSEECLKWLWENKNVIL